MVWMFGYGSLIWKIDFPFIRRITGYVEGFHRTMEWADEVHRGVPGRQSRTAAIFKSDDPKERVWGVAFEISQDYWDRVLEERVGYRERGGYGTSEVEFHQFDTTATPVKEKIMVWLVTGDKSNPNYKPGTIDELAGHIVAAVGASGTNLEYVYQTAEAIRMILPPGETDKHLFDLEAACRKLEAEMKSMNVQTVASGDAYLDDKYERRRDMLKKIFRACDRNMDRGLGLQEFQHLAINTLNLNQNVKDIEEKFKEIDKDKNGKLSTSEFVDYFLNELAKNEKKFKDEYEKFGLENNSSRNFEQALLMYESLDGLKTGSKSQVSLKDLLEENSKIVERLRIVTNPKAREVLEFWFPSTIKDAMMLWFGRCEQTDKKIKERFSSLTKQALNGDLDSWLQTATDTLALVIVLTQFTRSVYRGTPEAWSGDNKALGAVLMAIFRGYTRALTPLQTAFLPCIALSCHENIHCHELSTEIWINYVSPRLPADDPLRIIQKNLRNSFNIIKKFGRFPSRNKILNRESTQEEAMYMTQLQAAMDKPVTFNDDGTVVRDGTEDDVDTVITQLLFKQPNAAPGSQSVKLSDEKIASLNTKA